MLRIEVSDGDDLFDEENNRFIIAPKIALDLEHSLVSLSKWESRFEKPFLSDVEKTDEETLWYIRAMTLTPDVPDHLYDRLDLNHLRQVNDYIAAKMTATWFSQKLGEGRSRSRTGEAVTAELIYYWMISLNIPFECQHWHLNRLITLVEVCNRKNSPKKKLSPSEIAARNRQLNEERRKKFGTTG